MSGSKEGDMKTFWVDVHWSTKVEATDADDAIGQVRAIVGPRPMLTPLEVGRDVDENHWPIIDTRRGVNPAVTEAEAEAICPKQVGQSQRVKLCRGVRRQWASKSISR